MASTEYKTDEEKKTFYNSTSWKSLRQQALERDNWECQQCKREGKVHVDSVKVDGQRKSVELNVHHKYEIEMFPKLALFIDNLETLCLYHHNEVHGRNEVLKKFKYKRKKTKWDGDEKW